MLFVELLLDPHEPVRVGELRDEILREPRAMRSPNPIVNPQIAIERGAPEPEARVRLVLHRRVLQREIVLLVPDPRELRAGLQVCGLDVLQIALEKDVIWLARSAGEMFVGMRRS